MEPLEMYNTLRTQGYSAVEAWGVLREKYRQDYLHQKPGGDAEQAWKSTSGKVFEKIVLHEFATQVQPIPILRVASWTQLPASLQDPLSERLWVRGELQPIMAESNVDIIAYEVSENEVPKRIIAVYSCKVSLRERFQQDLFWAERLRGRGVRFCFVTLDNDGVLIRAARQGSLESKQARMATALYDKIYLFWSEEEIQHFKGVFRSIEALGKDLTLWQRQD
jgi:hypothetical protein